VFLAELLGKSSAHDLAANARRSLEMSLAALAARRANVYVEEENEESALVVNLIVEMSASGQNGANVRVNDPQC
jgi:hypothetical protein